MSAKHVAKESAAWTRELGVILLDGIQDNTQGKQQAQGRVKALHPLPPGKDCYPKDFEKWLTKVFEKPSEDGVPSWLTLEFWQQEVDKVLIQGISARSVTQDEVVQRVRAVWPKLSISWLGARTEEVARTGLPRWMDQTFWAAGIDPILLSGLRNASQCQCEAVETVLHAFPQLHVGMIWDRLRRLRKQRTEDLHTMVSAFAVANGNTAAADGQADSSATAQAGRMALYSKMDQKFWRAEVDPILLGGIRNANQLERETVDRVLRRFSELRIGTIWARLRRLRERRKENGNNGPPFRWTDELDERLIRIHEEAGWARGFRTIPLRAFSSALQVPPVHPGIEHLRVDQIPCNGFQSDRLGVIGISNTRGKLHARLVENRAVDLEIKQTRLGLPLFDASRHRMPHIETQMDELIHAAPPVQ